MKLFTTKNLLIAFSCFAFILFSGQIYAETTKNETPTIVKECQGLSQADIDNFTTRFYDLNQDKRALLNGMILEAYGKKGIKYDKVHLNIMYKSVESYTPEKTRQNLELLYRAAGN